MKVIITFLALIACAVAQRPSYAGSEPIGRPGLANRFKDTETTTLNLNNRIGDDATTTTDRIPVDARGDGNLVNRLNQWPREHRPFWLLNAEHIEASRNQNQQQQVANRNTFGEGNGETIPVRPTAQRSSFLPPLNSNN